MTIRPATRADLPAMLDLAERKREQYARYQPVFWRPAPDARERQEPFFAGLMERAIVLVAEREAGGIAGFVIAQLAPAPPVYAPGGPTCSIDDFALADASEWATVGRALLDAASEAAAQRGAAQTVVVCGHMDEEKRTMLRAAGYAIASEWYTRPNA